MPWPTLSYQAGNRPLRFAVQKGDVDLLLGKRHPYQLQPHQIDLLKPVQQLPRDDGAGACMSFQPTSLAGVSGTSSSSSLTQWSARRWCCLVAASSLLVSLRALLPRTCQKSMAGKTLPATRRLRKQQQSNTILIIEGSGVLPLLLLVLIYIFKNGKGVHAAACTPNWCYNNSIIQ